MKPLLLFAIALLFSTSLLAQENITAAGSNGGGSGGSVSYSVGQIDYRSSSGSNGKISEGVQQAIEIFTVGTEELEIALKIFPNPTTDQVSIVFDHLPDGMMDIELFDLSGRKIFTETISVTQVVVPLSSYPAGTYLLKVIGQKRTNTYKIIKH